MPKKTIMSLLVGSTLMIGNQAMAAPVLRHRMALSFGARARGETVDGLIARIRDSQLRKAA